MELKRLDWDSDFLGREVFGVQVLKPADLTESSLLLRNSGAQLAYFFLPDPDPRLCGQLTDLGAILYDEKITYGKKLAPGLHLQAPVSKEIEPYDGELTDELLHLSILAGHESRFRKDPRLLPYFEQLYKIWITNSLNGTFADRVFVYRTENGIKGMVSCKLGKDQSASIGLIATDAGSQGKGIGRSLLLATDHFYSIHQVTTSTVVTQKSNIQACRFYEKAGFVEYKTEYVYHLWFN